MYLKIVMLTFPGFFFKEANLYVNYLTIDLHRHRHVQDYVVCSSKWNPSEYGRG